MKRRQLLKAVTASGIVALGGQGKATQQPPRRIVGTSSRDAVEAARGRAAQVTHVLDFGDIGQAVTGRFSDRAVRELEQRDDVRYVERDGRNRPLQQQLPWGIDRIDADVAHEAGETGNGVDVAIIDAGVDSDHPDLQGNLGRGR